MIDLPDDLREELADWALRAWPREACGLLIGTQHTGGTRVARVTLARNLERDRRDRYEIDPADHLAAQTGARRDGLEVVGAWHSHPNHPAVPSETDRRAAWEGWTYLIVPCAESGSGTPRAWRLEDGSFREQRLDGSG